MSGELAVADQGVEQVRADLERLRAGATGWASRNVVHLDPADTELPTLPKVKASTELSMLSRVWLRALPDDEGLVPVLAAVRRVWEDPATPGLVATSPSFYRQFVLTYAALAPAGTTTDHHLTPVADVAPDGYLVPYGRSPYLRLEARYYADLLGLRHGFESYRELYDASVLANLHSVPIPMDIEKAYKITHTLFFMTDFGSRDIGLGVHERERAFALIDVMTDHFVEVQYWDLIAEMVLSQHCLGVDPTGTRSGAAAIRTLLQAQTADGNIPGRFASQRAPENATAVELFRKSFHTTLAAAIASLAVLSSQQRG